MATGNLLTAYQI